MPRCELGNAQRLLQEFVAEGRAQHGGKRGRQARRRRVYSLDLFEADCPIPILSVWLFALPSANFYISCSMAVHNRINGKLFELLSLRVCSI